MSALIVVVLLGVSAGGLVIAGTYVLGGLGVALLVSGVLLFAAAVFMRSGIRTNVQ